MAAADALAAAGNLIARFGHDNRTGIAGCELTGFSIPGAIARAVSDLVADVARQTEAHQFARMRGWAMERAAVSYVVQVLGYDPAEYGPFDSRELVARAADGYRGRGLGTGWALAVLDDAHAIAAAAAPRTAGAALVERTRLLALLSLPATTHRAA